MSQRGAANTKRRSDNGDLAVLSEQSKWAAMFIAKIVRDGMEDFHIEHLSDQQMAELNPIIRNAIAAALHVLERSTDPRVQPVFALTLQSIPEYWEPPVLPDDFVALLKKFEEEQDNHRE